MVIQNKSSSPKFNTNCSWKFDLSHFIFFRTKMRGKQICKFFFCRFQLPLAQFSGICNRFFALISNSSRRDFPVLLEWFFVCVGKIMLWELFSHRHLTLIHSKNIKKTFKKVLYALYIRSKCEFCVILILIGRETYKIYGIYM